MLHTYVMSRIPPLPSPIFGIPNHLPGHPHFHDTGVIEHGTPVKGETVTGSEEVAE